MSGLDLAVIGNCTWGGLVDPRARLVWACLPRFDSDPLFPALLDGDERRRRRASRSSSRTSRAPSSATTGNTPILVTTLRDRAGGAIEIRDFAPRFRNHGRFYRPTMLVRRVRPLAGEPRIRIVLRPRCDYGAGRPATDARQQPPALRRRPSVTLRLTTDAPISYVADGDARSCSSGRSRLILGPDESRSPRRSRSTARDFEERTHDYWMRVGAHALDPVRVAGRGDPRRDHAQAVHVRGDRRDRRGAHHVDPGGAGQRPQLGLSLLLAARRLLRDPGAEPARRDAHDGGLPVLHRQPRRDRGRRRAPAALRRSGSRSALEERVAPRSRATAGWGRCGSATRRSSQLAERRLRQRRARGDAVVLRPPPAAPGRRFAVRMLETIGEHALRAAGTGPTPGSGSSARSKHVHTFSAVMCWAACDRLARIAAQLGEPIARSTGAPRPSAIRAAILERAWSETRGSFVGALRRRRARRVAAPAARARLPAPPTIRASSRRSPRSSASCAAAPTSSAMRTDDFGDAAAPRSTSARSGTSTRSPRSGGATRRASCSRTCSRGATGSGCSPRISTRRRASSGATSRRPTRWSG